MSVNIKNENFIKKEIDKLQLLIYNFRIILLGNNPEYLLLNSTYNDPGILAKDKDNEALIVEISSNNLDTASVGKYNIIYNIKNNNNTLLGNYIRELYVLNENLPTIIIIGSNPLNIIVNSNINDYELGAIASDYKDKILHVTKTTDLNIKCK